MARKRTYGDPCGIARGLDVIGDRWALLIARELLLGPKRFTDLRDGLPSLGPDVLSQRLRELEASGVVRRAQLAPPASARVYELTNWGRELEPVLLALGRWGSQAPFPAGTGPLGQDAFVIALKTLFSPAAADGLDASYELTLGGHPYKLIVRDGRLEATHGHADAPTAWIDTDTGTLAAVLWHDAPLDEAIRTRQIRIDGDGNLVARFLELFRTSDVAED